MGIEGRYRGVELEDAVEQTLNICGLYFLRIKNYRCFACGQVQNSQAAGFPDFHVPSLSLYVECKTGKGKLSPEQKKVRAAIERDPNNKYLLVKDNVDTLLQFLRLEGYIST